MQTIQVTMANKIRNLFPIAGAMLPTGKRIVGLFETPEDARSINADELAWGITSYDKLTPEEQAIADANADFLDEQFRRIMICLNGKRTKECVKIVRRLAEWEESGSK